MEVWGSHGSQDNQSLYITVLREKPKRRRFCFAIAPVAERQNGYRQNSMIAILVFSKRAAEAHKRRNAERVNMCGLDTQLNTSLITSSF